MKYPNLPIVSIGALPKQTREDLAGELHGFSFHELQIDEKEDWAAMRDELDQVALTLPQGDVLVCCTRHPVARKHLESALIRLAHPNRKLHLVLPLAFSFESPASRFAVETFQSLLFSSASLIHLDGPSIMARLPKTTTLSQLFHAHDIKLSHLLIDLRQILLSPKNRRAYKELKGELVWHGTWPSPASAVEHMASLLRSLEDPNLAVIIGHGIAETARLSKFTQRLGMGDLPVCTGMSGSRRLGALCRGPMLDDL